MDNEVLVVSSAPAAGVILDTIIFAAFVTVVAGIIGCVTVLNALDAKTATKAQSNSDTQKA